MGEQLPYEDVFVDGSGVGDIGPAVMREREALARDGFVIAVVPVSLATGELTGRPELVSRGFVYLPREPGTARQGLRTGLSPARGADHTQVPLHQRPDRGHPQAGFLPGDRPQADDHRGGDEGMKQGVRCGNREQGEEGMALSLLPVPCSLFPVPCYLASSTARVSRITVTLICPGYSRLSSIFLAMSRARRMEARSSMSSGLTMIRISRPA